MQALILQLSDSEACIYNCNDDYINFLENNRSVIALLGMDTARCH
jgi:hypothetical protein